MLYVFKSNTGGGERRPHIEELFLLAAADLGAAPRVVERRALRALLLRQRFQHLAADVLQLILFVIGAVYRVQVLHRLRLLLPAHAVDDLDASGATSSSSISSTGLSSYYSSGGGGGGGGITSGGGISNDIGGGVVGGDGRNDNGGVVGGDGHNDGVGSVSGRAPITIRCRFALVAVSPLPT